MICINKKPTMSPVCGKYSTNITYRCRKKKGFDKAEQAEITCPKWRDLAGFKAASTVDLLWDFGLHASLSEPWFPICRLPALSFSPLCPQNLT